MLFIHLMLVFNTNYEIMKQRFKYKKQYKETK